MIYAGKKSKAIVFDASTLISFAMNGLLRELEELKKIFQGKFIITKEVREETIEKPLTINKFKFEAMQIKSLVERNILETPESLGVKEKDISRKTKKILDIANSIFEGKSKNDKHNKRKIHLIDVGEASCLALGSLLKDKKIEIVMAVDERTTRMLCEKPEVLKKFLEKKLHTKINFYEEKHKFLKGFKFIRSTELIYVAYKKDIINIKDKNLLDALLHAMKSKGAAISNEEIREIKNFDKTI